MTSVVFTALHGMQTRSSDENPVCLSVRLSDACIVTERKKDLSRFLYHTKEPSFLRSRMVGGGNSFYLNFWSTGPRWSEIADFQPLFARSASAVTRKPPKRGLRNAKRPFSG